MKEGERCERLGTPRPATRGQRLRGPFQSCGHTDRGSCRGEGASWVPTDTCGPRGPPLASTNLAVTTGDHKL